MTNQTPPPPPPPAYEPPTVAAVSAPPPFVATSQPVYGPATTAPAVYVNTYVPVTPVAPRPYRGMAIASMVLGILAWVGTLLTAGLMSPLSLLMCLIGLPLAAVALNRGRREDTYAMGVTGAILCGLGLVGLVILVVVLAAGVGAMGLLPFAVS